MKAGRVLILIICAGILLGARLPAAAQPPASLPEILEFDRKLCPVCREAELIIQAVKNRYPGQFVVRKLYIDEDTPLFLRFRVAIVPTQVFLDRQGKEVFRHEGVFPQPQVIQKLRELKFIGEAH
jgi:thioredoxin 1